MIRDLRIPFCNGLESRVPISSIEISRWTGSGPDSAASMLSGVGHDGLIEVADNNFTPPGTVTSSSPSADAAASQIIKQQKQ